MGCKEPQATEDETDTTQTEATDAAAAYKGAVLPSELKEISGMSREGACFWAISDAPKPVVFKIDQQGKILQQNEMKGIKPTDMESLTSDDRYIYIGDVGDNKEKRTSRNVIKIAKSALSGKGAVECEVMTFKFNGSPDLNCEAMLAHGDSLYFFTKQNDGRTQLFSISKQFENGSANQIAELEAGGMITDASINPSGNEVALVGYGKGHRNPFVILLTGFSGNNFLSGTASWHQLKQAGEDWQVESISYVDDERLTFACEKTKDVPQTLYTITRTDLLALPEPLADNSSNTSGHKDGKKKNKRKKDKNE